MLLLRGFHQCRDVSWWLVLRVQERGEVAEEQTPAVLACLVGVAAEPLRLNGRRQRQHSHFASCEGSDPLR